MVVLYFQNNFNRSFSIFHSMENKTVKQLTNANMTECLTLLKKGPHLCISYLKQFVLTIFV